MRNSIAIITDFGLKDWFTASMKAVIFSINPNANIIDICHDIPQGDIQKAAFCLYASHNFFPKGTIFLAVVDPGVGSKRKAIAVKTTEHFFIGPDNGVLSLCINKYQSYEIRLLENKNFFLKEISSTFHGRDIFAPVAAYLSRGVSFNKVGTKTNNFITLSFNKVEETKKYFIGKIIYIDIFGNAITNFPISFASKIKSIYVKNKKIPLKKCYSDVGKNEFLSLPGSCGFIEISANCNSAEKLLKLKVDDKLIAEK
jgi:S-adenosylmethionine hydrolase